ncbi:MAG: hypothetical protein R6U13_06635 [Desulfatiglandaceae bacterium]
MTPLMVCRSPEMVTTLLDKGADLHLFLRREPEHEIVGETVAVTSDLLV